MTFSEDVQERRQRPGLGWRSWRVWSKELNGFEWLQAGGEWGGVYSSEAHSHRNLVSSPLIKHWTKGTQKFHAHKPASMRLMTDSVPQLLGHQMFPRHATGIRSTKTVPVTQRRLKQHTAKPTRILCQHYQWGLLSGRWMEASVRNDHSCKWTECSMTELHVYSLFPGARKYTLENCLTLNSWI